MSQSRPLDPEYLSKFFLGSVASVVLAAVLLVATAGWWKPAAAPITEIPRASLTLRFVDQPDGGLSVVDMSSGQEMDHLAQGENGFLRTMIRVVRRDLDRSGDIISMPFRIEAWQDNRVTLTDSINGRSIDLRAFGPTNSEVFIRWLLEKEARG